VYSINAGSSSLRPVHSAGVFAGGPGRVGPERLILALLDGYEGCRSLLHCLAPFITQPARWN
jgi:hypothetical protein